MAQHLLAFWNVENLFGPEDHPHRIDWVKEQVKSDLMGWSEQMYRTKLAQLAKVIVAMKDGAGPDILGVCEVEDEYVLGDLSDILNDQLHDRDYGIVYATNDASFRGIDTAFIYDMSKFTVDPALVFNHFVMRRTGTRDILQATFKSVATGGEMVVMANHWPSRHGGNGKAASAGFRATAAETLAYWHERIRELSAAKERTPVIAFGDMNDDPWDDSVTINALATRERGDVERSTSAKFYNLTWEYLLTDAIDHQGNPRLLEGSLYYDNDGNLFDQVYANRALLDDAPAVFKLTNGTAGIFHLPEMVSHKKGEGPRRFGQPKKGDLTKVDLTGFSDHFPVVVEVSDA